MTFSFFGHQGARSCGSKSLTRRHVGQVQGKVRIALVPEDILRIRPSEQQHLVNQLNLFKSYHVTPLFSIHIWLLIFTTIKANLKFSALYHCVFCSVFDSLCSVCCLIQTETRVFNYSAFLTTNLKLRYERRCLWRR